LVEEKKEKKNMMLRELTWWSDRRMDEGKRKKGRGPKLFEGKLDQKVIIRLP